MDIIVKLPTSSTSHSSLLEERYCISKHDDYKKLVHMIKDGLSYNMSVIEFWDFEILCNDDHNIDKWSLKESISCYRDHQLHNQLNFLGTLKRLIKLEDQQILGLSTLLFNKDFHKKLDDLIFNFKYNNFLLVPYKVSFEGIPENTIAIYNEHNKLSLVTRGIG